MFTSPVPAHPLTAKEIISVHLTECTGYNVMPGSCTSMYKRSVNLNIIKQTEQIFIKACSYMLVQTWSDG